MAFEGGCVTDPVDEGPVLVGRDGAGLGVDGPSLLGGLGGVVAFETALQGGFVEVVEAVFEGGDLAVEDCGGVEDLDEGDAWGVAEVGAGTLGGGEVHGQVDPLREGLHALGQLGELAAGLPLVDEVLHRPHLLLHRLRGLR